MIPFMIKVVFSRMRFLGFFLFSIFLIALFLQVYTMGMA